MAGNISSTNIYTQMGKMSLNHKTKDIRKAQYCPDTET